MTLYVILFFLRLQDQWRLGFRYCQILSIIRVGHRGRELPGHINRDNAIAGSAGLKDIIDLTEDSE